MIISNRVKENVKWLCGEKGVKYNVVEQQCHLSFGAIGNRNYRLSIDDVYYIAQFFNVTVDDLMSQDYYTASLNKRIDELEEELSELHSIKRLLQQSNVGLPSVDKTIDDVSRTKPTRRRHMNITPDKTVIEFVNAGFYQITENVNDYIPTWDIYKVYSTVTPDPVDRRVFGRYMKAMIPCNENRALKRTIDGKSTSVIYGIKTN